MIVLLVPNLEGIELQIRNISTHEKKIVKLIGEKRKSSIQLVKNA